MLIDSNIKFFILAGGQSKRMGTDKGLVLFKNQSLIQHVINAILPLSSQITIIANSNNYSQLGYKVISDSIINKGPLSGIYSGLATSDTENNFFLSCDMPLIKTELLKFIVLKMDVSGKANIARHNNFIEPMCGIYSKAIIPLLKQQFESNDLKILNVLNQTNVNYIDVDNESFYNKNIFRNINSMDDITGLEKLDHG
ncbi:MAG: molybdenum cofactor guanylyltransferase [Bacteroidia bacterium]